MSQKSSLLFFGIMLCFWKGEKDMYKKILCSFILVCVLCFYEVNAKENFYQNNKEVILTKEEYEFISELYWNGYQDYLTMEEYLDLKNRDLFNQKVETRIQEIENHSLTRSTEVTTNLRNLKISKVCSNSCTLTLTITFIGTPTVKSYDVLGVRTENVTISRIDHAKVIGDGYIKEYDNPQKFNNGFGYSLLLPNVGNVKAVVTFKTSKGGNVYGSYQHTMRNTTENISKQYSINENGFGRVFDFTGTTRNIYDNAPGVDIAV